MVLKVGTKFDPIHEVRCVKLMTFYERLLGGNPILFNFMFTAYS